MAAEVSSSEANSGLITRDFLGVSSDNNQIDSKELDLDLHVPFGWEKRLDLQSGKVYIQRSNNPTTKTAQNQRTLLTNQHHIPSKLQHHLNTYPTLNLLEQQQQQQQQQQQPSLDLKLVSNNSSSPSPYTSVCTLDKVKSALHRAERSSPSPSTSSSRKRWMSSPSPSNNSSSPEDEAEKMSSSSSSGKGGSSLLVAAACPGCFLFVLVSKNDPKCPKCSSIVNLPVMTISTKKAKFIDLNISM